MKTLGVMALVVCGAVVGGASSVAGAGLTTIDGVQLERLMADGNPLVIVDVREPELFAAGRVRGAINIPYDDARLRIFRELRPQDRIAFVCHGGPMGDELGRLLAANGYREVYNLKGGMKKWRGEVVH